MTEARISGYCRVSRDGVEIFVRLTPKSSRNAIEGAEEAGDGKVHIKARVRAVPEDGKANAALEKLIAEWLKVPKADVEVVSGATSRLKGVAIRGDSKALLSKIVLAGETFTGK